MASLRCSWVCTPALVPLPFVANARSRAFSRCGTTIFFDPACMAHCVCRRAGADRRPLGGRTPCPTFFSRPSILAEARPDIFSSLFTRLFLLL
ncbi:hypothetical protein pneo_cds_252 [Pandoravirus neocaledonia]|uniref:Uncharacterized protein n=1 Tax=Pandoravirus neocaledonia TaxID=2107708 RepID=A0A2U7UBM4_9VIRU|nr:hypothetical protein pneo_cds_252 [Pandoravirus neocaledonia]AVK75859.1 hypothetical protein pneo_cds_252 [Pandoravirus neocaledonia]